MRGLPHQFCKILARSQCKYKNLMKTTRWLTTHPVMLLKDGKLPCHACSLSQCHNLAPTSLGMLTWIYSLGSSFPVFITKTHEKPILDLVHMTSSSVRHDLNTLSEMLTFPRPVQARWLNAQLNGLIQGLPITSRNPQVRKFTPEIPCSGLLFTSAFGKQNQPEHANYWFIWCGAILTIKAKRLAVWVIWLSRSL